jgi:hypothetical protein
MPSLESPQKGFYDTLRQFQRKDEPTREPGAPAGTGRGVPIGQVIAGVAFLGIIFLAFVSFAIPPKPIGLEGGGPAAAAAAPAPAAAKK